MILKRITFEPPPPRAVTLDEKTNAYIERLRAETEFSGPVDIKIDDFEGPLDLLLHLVKAAKVPIEDIFISRITDQYLTIIANMGSIELDRTGEFIEIAAILLEIKSKALLPKPDPEPVDENDQKRALIRRLEEYKVYKEAGEKMKKNETVGIFFKLPDPSVGDPLVILRDMTMDGLTAAMQKLFLKAESRAVLAPPRKVTLDRFTVAEKMGHIRDIMLVREEVNFFELFEADYSKSEIITTFQALLELLKLQEISAVQPDIFADITLRRKEKDAPVEAE
jgi:segregation and condensation protein A